MFIDLSNTKYMLYGKINNHYQIISPNIKKISTIQIGNNQNYINPITKYFLEKLLLDFRKASLTGRMIKENSVLYPITVKTAGQDVYLRYEIYLSGLIDAFILRSKKLSTFDELVSLEDFIREFTKFCLKLDNGPFTFSSYVISKYNAIRTTGLVVKLFDNRDIESDINYNLYTNTVVNNGFLIDEFNKGTIILNFGHETVINKMKEDGITNISQFYSTYFTEASNLDINLFSYVILKKFNEVCARTPVATQVKMCSTNSFINENKIRNPINYNKLYTKYNYLFWLKIYLYLRGIETYKNWSQNEFDFFVTELTNVYKSAVDKQYYSGLQYVLKLIGKYPYSQKIGQINFYYEPRL